MRCCECEFRNQCDESETVLSETVLTAFVRCYKRDRLLEEKKAKTKPDWISVKERLPERFEPVLVCREKNGSPYVEQGHKDVGEWWKVYGTRTKQVTHWMPLPEPPEEG